MLGEHTLVRQITSPAGTDLARLLELSESYAAVQEGIDAQDEALIGALRAERIGGAALDVFDTEPLPADHPLRKLPNATLTGHIGYVTRDLYELFYGGAVEDIAAFQAGNPIRVMG